MIALGLFIASTTLLAAVALGKCIIDISEYPHD